MENKEKTFEYVIGNTLKVITLPKKSEFKNEDIIYISSDKSMFDAICIFKKVSEIGLIYNHCTYFLNTKNLTLDSNFFGGIKQIREIRYATKEEKEILLSVLEEKDLMWHNGKIQSTRATGRTTRLIDSYIQELFENINKHVIIKDHYYSKQADRYLMIRIHDRLKYEHPNVDFLCKIIDNNYTIKIIK